MAENPWEQAAVEAESLAKRLRDLADTRDEDLADAEMNVSLLEAELDMEREEFDLAATWRAAEALHHEAHDRWQFRFCRRETCVALKDVLLPGWQHDGAVVV